MIKNKSKSGFTLIEILVSIALLALLISMFLSVFLAGSSNIVFSGKKSEELMNLQSITDDLNQQKFQNRNQLQNYLVATKGYREVSDVGQINNYVTGKDINCYVSAEESKADVAGFTVTLVKFVDNGTRSARLSTFIIKEGG